MMTAQQARQLADYNSKNNRNYELLVKRKVRIIDNLIEDAASKGKTSIIYNEYVSRDVIGHYEEYGFTVKTYTNLMASENCNSVQISW